ncbi:hypothetical protein HYX09_06105 [Candidatus Woesearchaeota archaeon]|nr:hypothetical protein [Candidatus Woesearchaeota archaeon]
MVSLDEVNRKLAALYRVHGISHPPIDLEVLISGSRLDEAHVLLDGRFDAIQAVLTSQLGLRGESMLYEPLRGRLTEEQYVLPPELEEAHPVILANITSGKTIEHFTHGGLLLYDNNVGGTGKTEYPMFLAAQAGEGVCFVRVNGNAIRESDKPGTVLKRLYSELEERAIREGVMYVAFIDEFEKLVNKYAKQHAAVREEGSSTVTDEGGRSEFRRETRETLEVDDIGEQLFSTLKDCVSGAEQIRHVFTIAASNQSAYPVTLLRRLQPVELHPFGIMEVRWAYETSIPDYGTYNESVPRLLAVLQATYVRLNEGKKNPVIERIAMELQPILDNLRQKYGVPSSKGGTFHIRIEEKAHRNNAYLEELLGYFGCDLKKEQEDFNVKWDILCFAGQMEIVGHNASQVARLSLSDGKTSQEVEVMRALTPDAVAKWYKSNPAAFSGYDAAKQFIGQCIFPQLKALADHKSG